MTHFRTGFLIGFTAFYVLRFCIAELPTAGPVWSIADWVHRVDSVVAQEVWR